MRKKVEIGSNARVNIKWNVEPINYSHEAEADIIALFAKKYGIQKDRINVEPVFVIKDADGNEIAVTDGLIGDVQDPKFQQNLFKKYINANDVKGADMDYIIEIDNSINAEIDYDKYEKRKKYAVKWLRWSNFMSYGKDNFIDLTKLSGLVLLESDPSNQAGKSTFSIDLLRFLLFGKVTSRENDWTLAKAFNSHLPEATEVTVEGCVEFDGVDYVIKRVLSRPSLAKRTDKSKVTQKLYYYKLVNGEYIELADEEDASGDDGRQTNKIIKETIGNERDFDLMICIDADNLKSLISLKDADRGRLVSRWIGLLPLEEKDKLARDKFNTSVMKNLLTNRYDKHDVEDHSRQLEEDNKGYAEGLKEFEGKRGESDKKLINLREEKEKLIASKEKIDDSLTKVDIVTLETTIKRLSEEGKQKAADLKAKKDDLSKIKDVEYNEEDYKALEKKYAELNGEIVGLRTEVKAITKEIESLKSSEFCPTCGAKLKGVDNTEAIKAKTTEKEEKVKKGIALSEEQKRVEKEKEEMAAKREEYNVKVRAQLLIDKIEVDIENLRSRYKESSTLKKNIEANKEAIKRNNDIDTKINVINESIKAEERILKDLDEQIAANKAQIKINEKQIGQNQKIIETLIKEESIIRNWKLYLEMIGKNGICKMVIRDVLPFINGELKHILNGVCDFGVEVQIDNHNDVAFDIIKDGVRSNLGSGSGFEKTVSSLALRSVLSKISTFSKPSFVVLDEVLGGVADENYDNVKLLYDKIVKDYAFVLQITHLKQLFEWHKHTIKIVKDGNISSIKFS